MALGASQLSKRPDLGYCAAMDILDHVASSVDIYRLSTSFHTQGHLNKSSRIHAANSNKFVRILLGYLSRFVRMDPSDTSSRMDHANKFSRIPLAHLSMFSRMDPCENQGPSTIDMQQSIKNTKPFDLDV